MTPTLRQLVETETILAGLHKGADAYEDPQPEIVAAIEAVEGLTSDDDALLRHRLFLDDWLFRFEQIMERVAQPPEEAL